MDKIDILDKMKEHALEEMNQLLLMYNHVNSNEIKIVLFTLMENYVILARLISTEKGNK